MNRNSVSPGGRLSGASNLKSSPLTRTTLALLAVIDAFVSPDGLLLNAVIASPAIATDPTTPTMVVSDFMNCSWLTVGWLRATQFVVTVPYCQRFLLFRSAPLLKEHHSSRSRVRCCRKCTI